MVGKELRKSECTFCPPNTNQCAHFDGHWVRLTVGVDCINPDNVPAVTWNFGYGKYPTLAERNRFAWTVFYHPPSVLSDAEEYFQVLNVIMRKIAREVPGDDST